MADKPSLKCREDNIMKIHPLNYEAYAMDYLEGSLSNEDQLSFERFLDDQPEIAAELQAMKVMYVQPDPEVTFEPKASLMQEVPQARTFKLPFWAIAASWALVIGSFAFWFSNAVAPEDKLNAAFADSIIETTPEVEHQVEVVQLLPKGQQINSTEQQAPVQTWSPERHLDWNGLVYGDNGEQADIERENQSHLPVVTTLPTAKLEPELFSNQTQVIYYRPWKGYKRNTRVNDRIDDIAVLDPLKRISPKRYLKIRDFDLVDDVIKEIDGEQIARAITPEIIK